MYNYDRQIDLPKRADNHIRETTGYKVLESVIPPEWIIRCVTERDYGVDCYIELVDEHNNLTGEIAFVQMKATDAINWRLDNGVRFYKVEKSTTNYLRSFRIPTYLFLVDLSTKELFFVSVKEYVAEHYDEYMANGTFAYEFYHDRDIFTIDAFLRSFRRNNKSDQFHNELQHFILDMEQYVRFMQDHNYRDCFLQIEPDEMIRFEAMHRNISFLQNHFGTNMRLTPIHVLYKNGENKYGEAYEHTLYEGILTDFFDEFKESVLEIFDKIKELVTVKERYYWLMEERIIYKYIVNMEKETLFAI